MRACTSGALLDHALGGVARTRIRMELSILTFEDIVHAVGNGQGNGEFLRLDRSLAKNREHDGLLVALN